MKRTEVFLGAGIGVLLFLWWIGVNFLPYLVLGALIYVLASSRGQLGEIGRKKVGAAIKGQLDITFGDVGGQSVAKRELMEALLFLKDYDEARSMGIRPLKGILLTGPPGTGKTMLAKAAASYTDSVFISSSGSEFIEVYAGLGAQRVRNLFERARKAAKEQKKKSAIVFVDEIEVLAGRRGAQVGHLEYDQTLNQLLVEMDGLTVGDDVRILVLGATNRPDLLDSAILRPGRFDRRVGVDLPDKDGRLEILKLHLRNKPLEPELDMEKIAKETFGLSGAHIESLCNEAAIGALRKGQKVIAKSHIDEALDKVLMGEKLDRRPPPEEIRRVAVHEAGHAIVSEALRPGSVAQVTVSPRGDSLGYVRHTPKDDAYIYPREVLEEEIEILVAGAVAEDIVFGSRSTGASGDFKRALDIAKRMVAYGMSPLGIVDRDTASPDAIAKTTADILRRRHDKTSALLKRRRDKIEEIAKCLETDESLSGDALRALLGRSTVRSWVWRRMPKPKGNTVA